MTFRYNDIAEIYDELMKFIPYHEWAGYIMNLFYQHNGRQGIMIDLGTGTGKIAIEMSKFFEVYAIDIAFEMLRNFQQKEVSLSNINLVNGDITKLPFKRKFTLAVCIYDTVNHLSGEKFYLFLKNAFECLEAGGILIFDFNTDIGLLEFGNSEFLRHGREFKSHWKTEYSSETGVCTLNLKVIYNNGEEKKYVFRERKIEIDEIQKNLEKLNIEDYHFYNFPVFEKFDGTSERGMAVCIKT